MADARPSSPSVRDPDSNRSAEKRPWVPPEVRELPPLTELTLVTGAPIPGGGDTGGGGGTVF